MSGIEVVAIVGGVVVLVLLVLLAGLLLAVRSASDTVATLAARLTTLEEQAARLHGQVAGVDQELDGLADVLRKQRAETIERDHQGTTR